MDLKTLKHLKMTDYCSKPIENKINRIWKLNMHQQLVWLHFKGEILPFAKQIFPWFSDKYNMILKAIVLSEKITLSQIANCISADVGNTHRRLNNLVKLKVLNNTDIKKTYILNEGFYNKLMKIWILEEQEYSKIKINRTK